MRTLAPFEQLPFDEVPTLPRLAHGYFDARVENVRFASKAFGEDVEVHVRVVGQGPPLLLVHGFMTSSYSFRYLMEPLSKSFTLYVPDLIGSGRSSKPAAHYGPDNLARSIGETMRGLGIAGARVIGNSLGGYLMMRLALLEPAMVGRLVNLHSPGLATLRIQALSLLVATLPDVEPLVRFLVWRDPERWVHKNVHYFDESLKSREEHAEYAAPLRSREGLHAFVRMLIETLDADEMKQFEAELTRLGRFPVPLQLVYAERDPMVPPSVGDRLHALLPDVEMVRLSNASHFAHVDATGVFVRAVMPFLTR